MCIGNFSIHLIDTLCHESNVHSGGWNIDIQAIADRLTHIHGIHEGELSCICLKKISKLHHDSHSFPGCHLPPSFCFKAFFCSGNGLIYVFFVSCCTCSTSLVGCRIDDFYLSAICCINIFTINETSSFEDTIGIARHLGPIIFRQCFCASRIHSFLLVFIYFC